MTGRTSIPEVEAHRLMREGRYLEALPLAERAIAAKSRCDPAHGLQAAILMHLGRFEEAAALVFRAAALEPGTADAYDGLAYVAAALGRHPQANGLYRRATEAAPHEARFWYNLACSERGLGRLLEAESACDRSIEEDPAHYPSYLLRAELRVQTPDFNHVEQLQRELSRAGSDYRATLFLGYALGKELDDLERFDEAFAWFSAAARTRRSRLKYDIAADEAKLRRIAQVFDRPARAAPAGDPSSRHIFIVGLPRSGTTLTERILTGLSGARSNGETENFSRSLFAATRPATATAPGQGDVFARAAAADAEAVAANYARAADAQGTGGGIIEKLPMNYLYLGAIQRALPAARLLAVQRSPLDSCFAMYRTLFGEAYPFSYDLEELARYYAAYQGLMRTWRRVLGAGLHEIAYEQLVREPHRVGAAAAQYCGLAWTDAAVEIQRNAAVSLTASAAQVRRPIYGTSSGRWRRYRAHLGPLLAALRRHGVALPADA
jgi:tetratricopeptide (TPR) repeat protein